MPKQVAGSISGRAFVITKGGDLKPARYAKVFLLEPEPYVFFLKKHLAISKESFGEPIQRYSCELNMAGVDLAIRATMREEVEKGKVVSVRESQTDEDGNFRLNDVKPGDYAIIGRGQAGANDVYWELSEVKVAGRENVVVKLSQVTLACLAL
jgi:co-chaperonin GroES (HSP10)